MNKKILIGSIIAVVILVLVSSSSAIYVNISGDGFYELDEVKKYPVKFTIDGPTVVEEGKPYLYTFYLSPNPESDWFDMALWWGKGWGFFLTHIHTGEGYSEYHAWYRFPGEPFSFTIEATAYCGNSTYEATLEVGIKARAEQTINQPTISAVNVNINGDNHPPIIPTIDGETQPTVGVEYEYTFISDDPDGDNVSYYIEWGDGNITDWTPFQTQGSPGYKESHSWDEIGTYTLKAKAKDIWGAESDWMVVSIKVPKSKQITNLPFLQWLERFPLLNQLIIRLVEGWE